MPRNSPGVNFPPPTLFVLGFAIAWWLNRRWPLRLADGVIEVRLTLGWLLIGAGVFLAAAGFLTFLRYRTGIYPNQPATAIVTSGPYRFTRNPMYLAIIMIYLGLTLLTNMLWPLFLLPVVIAALQVTVIRREERYLREAFGETYAEYCRRVRRWI